MAAPFQSSRPDQLDIFTLSLTFDEPGPLSRVSSFWGVGRGCCEIRTATGRDRGPVDSLRKGAIPPQAPRATSPGWNGA